MKSSHFELAKSSSLVSPDIIKGLWCGLVIELFIWLELLRKLNTKTKLASIGILPASNLVCAWASPPYTMKHVTISYFCLIHLGAYGHGGLAFGTFSGVLPPLWKRPSPNGPSLEKVSSFKKIWAASLFVIACTLLEKMQFLNLCKPFYLNPPISWPYPSSP